MPRKGTALSSAAAIEMKVSLEDLKDLLSAHLCKPERMTRPEGLATGFAPLDRFLFWGGLPKGALSLLQGAIGTGATSFWIEAAARVISQGKWVAWVDGGIPLSPLSLHHRGLDLNRLVAVETPTCEKKLFWLLQELMSSSLFDLIGCDLGQLRLKEHQLRKLQAQARGAQIALTFLAQKDSRARSLYRGSSATVFSLIVNFEKHQICVERALHRPTPQSFPHPSARSVTYARFTIHTGDRLGLGSSTAPGNGGIELTERAQSEPSSLPSP